MTSSITNIPCFLVYNVLPNGDCSCDRDICNEAGKHPKCSWTTNFGYIKEKDFINNNYGIPTGSRSGVIAIDYDPRNDLAGDSIERFEAKLGNELNETITVNTPSGGWHKYYSIPKEVDFPISIKKELEDYPGIDIQGEGRYVIMVGSNHVKGTYKYAEGSPDDIPLEVIQPELLSFFENIANKKALCEISHGLEPISTEKLNEINLCLTKLEVRSRDEWLKVGMALHSIGNHDSKPFQLWKQWSQANDKKGRWKESDVRTWNSFKAGSINYKYLFQIAKEQGINPASIQIVPDMPGIDESINNLIKINEAKDFKVQPDKRIPPGYAGEIVMALNAQLDQTTPLHVVITMVTQILPSSIFHGYVCTPESYGSIAAYNLIIGQQGSGKTDAIRNINFMRRFIMGDEYVPGQKAKKNRQSMGVAAWPASGGGLLKSFKATNPMIITDDELLTKLHTVYQKDKNGDGLLGHILSCWSATHDSELIGQIAQKDEYNHPTVNSPALSLYGGGVTAQWKDLSADDGFMSRGIGTRVEITEWGKLVIPTRQKKINRRVQIVGELRDLLTRTQKFYQFCKTKYKVGDRRSVKCSSQVRDMIFEYDLDNRKKSNERPDYDCMNETRLAELAWRAATRLAVLEASVSENGKTVEGLTITTEQMEWAMDYVNNRFAIAQQTAGENNSEAGKYSEGVLKLLKQVKKKGTNKKGINQKYGKTMKPYERDKVLEELVESGEVCLAQNGAKKTYFLLRYAPLRKPFKPKI